MKRLCPLFLLFIVLAIGCQSPRPRELHFTGEAIGEILDQYGEPDVDVTFRLTEGLPQYRMGLLNHFRESEQGNTIIREWKWMMEEKTRAIWFKKVDRGVWETIEGLEWGKSIRF